MAGIILFGAKWCPVATPLERALAKEEVEYTYVDCELDPFTADKYSILSLPSVIILGDDGIVSAKLVGIFTISDILERFWQARGEYGSGKGKKAQNANRAGTGAQTGTPELG